MDAQGFVFLSHNSADKPAVEEIAKRLRAAGIEPWLDSWHLVPGEKWQPALEKALSEARASAVFVGPSGLGPWQDEEMRVAIDRRVGDSAYRVIPVLLPGASRGKRSAVPPFLANVTWVEFQRSLDDEQAFRRLVTGIEGKAPGPPLESTLAGTNPYRGLNVFDVADSSLFFGREALVGWLLSDLRTTLGRRGQVRLLAIVGASGSGKSSLARAGLLAQLKAGAVEDSQGWRYAILKPGADPLESLATAGSEVLGLADSKQILQFQDALMGDARIFHTQAALALRAAPAATRLLLLVDQFEEIFTLCTDEARRLAFIDNLLQAAAVVDGPIFVVLTLRADFVGKCAAYGQFATTLSDHQELVGPMSRDELREAIERPAWQSGCEFQSGLVDVLLDDVQTQPGALPLLQHALFELWRERAGRQLTHDAYDRIGRVQGALARRADEVYLSFTPDEQAAARRILLRLTQPGEGTEDTRRRARLSEIISSTDAKPTIERILRKLSDERLLVTEQDTVDVAHEALIRGWPTLREWLDQDREGLREHRRLSQAAEEWQGLGRDPSALYRGLRLDQVLAWRDRNEEALNALEREFIAASVRLRADERTRERQQEAGREAQRQRELEQARRRRQVWAGLVSLAFLVLVGFTGWNAYERHRAEQALADAKAAKDSAQVQRDKALRTESRSLAKLSREQTVAGYADVGVLLALEALPKDKAASGRPYVAEAEAALYQAVLAPHRVRTLPGSFETLSSDGTRLITQEFIEVGRGYIYRLWDAASGARLREWQMPKEHTCFYSRDAARVVTVRLVDDSFGEFRLWDTGKGAVIAVLPGHPQNVKYAEVRAAFSPDSHRVATAHSGDPNARLWDATTGRSIAVLAGHDGGVLDVAFSPDGRRIATASEGGSVRLWDGVDGHELAVLSAHGDAFSGLVFSPNGSRLLSLSRNHTGRLWNVNSGGRIAMLSDARGMTRGGGHPMKLTSAAFSPDGSRVAVSSENIATVWDTATGAVVAVLRGHDRRHAMAPDSNLTANITDVAFSPDGHLISTASQDGTTRLWDAAKGTSLAVLPADDSVEAKFIQSALFNAAGSLIVRQSGSTTQIWDSVTRTLLARIRSHSPQGMSLDGRYLYTGTDNRAGETHAWDITHGDLLRMVRTHKDAVLRVAFNATGTHFVTASVDGTARVFETASGREVAMLHGHGEGLPEVVEWKATDGNYRVSIYGAAVRDATFSPDGKRIVTASNDGTARVWDVPSGRALMVLRAHGADAASPHNPAAKFESMPVRRAAFSPDGTRIVTAGDDRTARIWDAATGRQLVVLRGHAKGIGLANFSSDGKLVVTGSEDETVRLWDAATGAQIRLLNDPRDDRGARSPVISPDGRFVLTLPGYTARLWDVGAKAERGEELQGANLAYVYRMETGGYASVSSPYMAAAFSADGRLVAASLGGGASRTWQVATRERLAENPECGAEPILASFTADGTRAVTVKKDGNVWLWDPFSGAPLGMLYSNLVVGSPRRCLAGDQGRYPAITAAALSPDSHHVVTGSMNGTIRILRIFPATQELVDYARHLVPRQLTLDERKRFLLDPR